MNYARHIPTSKNKAAPLLVFFRVLPPMPPEEFHEWAFHHVPHGLPPEHFRGRIVGEDMNQRCARLMHQPKQCDSCCSKRFGVPA